ncbi:hypothetical protein A3K86_11740 [Photobacterium jeanii]|uniref:Pilus assembly protein PilW n=1 Tax=Photobacterium jeanii TaxID=858640 RepID=A0A178KC89_9GAMM|nr:prepilin-type N-terminal cleavage/methylation domain-containing protein [Photobacterium jeanii]OAN14243.1 hypothetical protein A3K86_11740 [Photobacterium jeanii]
MANALTKHKGFSLVELMVASSISLMALAVVSSVFLSGYRLNSQRSLQLMMAQDLNDALKMMKEDIVRAGYNEGKGSSFVISGAASSMVVHLEPPPPAVANCISYGYSDGTHSYYRSYYKSNNRLNVYTTQSANVSVSDLCKSGHSIFDYEKIDVDKFDVNTNVISKAGVTSNLITINIGISSKDNTFTDNKSINVQTRNWG